MKKITGKVVSLVLALALVVTSFSATFAFAATKSVTGTVSDTANDEIYLSNRSVVDSGVNTVDLMDWIVPVLDTKDHQDVSSTVTISAISHASGDSLLKWDIADDNSDATLTVKSATKSGTEVISVLYESSYVNSDGDDVTVKARKNFTVHVLDEGSIVIGKVYDSGIATRMGKEVEAPATFAQTHGSSVQIGVYEVVKDSNSAMATYEEVPVTTATTGIAAGTYNIAVSDNGVRITNANIGTAGGAASPLTFVVGKGTNYATDPGVNNVTVTVKKVNATTHVPSTSSDDKYTLKTKIEKKVDVAQAKINESAAGTSYTIEKDGGKTKLYVAGHTDAIATVTDSEVVFPAGTTAVSADEGSVKKISGTVGALTINDDASVGTVDIDSGSVAVDGGKVGDITTSTSGDVTVTSGKAGNIDVTDDDTNTVTINGGVVGTIASDASVALEATDEDTAIATGKITAPSVSAFSSDAKISINGIKASANGTITLKGDKTTVGTIDLDYRTTTVALGDDSDAFTGTIAAPVNATNATLTTENEDTVATVTGTIDVNTISVGSDSDLKFDGAITVDSIDGDGAMTIAAGKLYVTGSVAGTTLKLSDKTLSKGTTVFKADSDTVSEDDFTTFGFTLATTTGSTVDTFKIDTLDFAGIVIDNSAAKVAVGYSKTFTAVAYPYGTTAPAGSTISWDFDGSDDVFDVTYSGNTATVKVKALDPSFASENEGTLTATLYDADGYELDDYAAATCDVTAIAVPEATSDTHNDLSVAKGASYTFKVTSATAPTFTTGTAGIFTVALASHTGNDYFYKITATGNVGTSTGIYLNGAKLLVASVKSNFTVDTTKDITVKGSYTLKVTSTATPTLGVGTAGVFSAQFVSKTGNDYFYKLTSVGAVGAKAGVFVNGTKVFVATVG